MSVNDRLSSNSTDSTHGQSAIHEFRTTLRVHAFLGGWTKPRPTKVCLVVQLYLFSFGEGG